MVECAPTVAEREESEVKLAERAATVAFNASTSAARPSVVGGDGGGGDGGGGDGGGEGGGLGGGDGGGGDGGGGDGAVNALDSTEVPSPALTVTRSLEVSSTAVSPPNSVLLACAVDSSGMMICALTLM